jgi:hypothetical protein
VEIQLGQLRILQRHVKTWRAYIARRLIPGCDSALAAVEGTNLNAFAERWIRSAEDLSKLIQFGGGPLTRTLAEFSAHYHGERNHQGKGNKPLFPDARDEPKQGDQTVACRGRLGGLLKYSGRVA